MKKSSLLNKITVCFIAGAMAVMVTGCDIGLFDFLDRKKDDGDADASVEVATLANGVLSDETADGISGDESDDMADDAVTDENGIAGDEIAEDDISEDEAAEATTEEMFLEDEVISWDETLAYAENSEIHTSDVTLYRSQAEERKGVTVAVNAGHGTSGGDSVRTLCHPDGTAKVTGGSTSAGSTTATAVAGGMTFDDGTPESQRTLELAIVVKEKLLDNGYDVLMIREDDDCQLDNIARTVLANQYANCHIALHYDSTSSDKGAFFIGVPAIDSYRSMEPVASHWEQHNAFGAALIDGLRNQGIGICGEGNIPLDLTQTSYSTVPSTDLEVGDAASDCSYGTQDSIAEGILEGLDAFFLDF